ncbi:MAG TPA: hypothetical protein VET88_11865 [Gammaproteobacteria bacterium]|nr:hypothetical protein [Gammaproteobacteria bacterium]
MDREKRKNNNPIPADLEGMLNAAQRQALPGIRFSGWELYFLRKPLFQPPVLVVRNSNDGKTGILDDHGRVSVQANIKVRRQACMNPNPTPDKPLVWTK